MRPALLEALERRRLLSSSLPRVTLQAEVSAAVEGAGDSLRFAVVRDATNITSPLTVRFALSGNASAGSDYPTPSGVVTIPANQRFAPITVAPINDTAVESRETVAVELVPDPAYTLGATALRKAQGTIADDDRLGAGTALLAPNAFNSFGWFGPASVSNVAVSDMPFSTARRVTLNSVPANFWEAQVRGNNPVAVNAGDKLLWRFWVRSVNSQPVNFSAVLEREGAPWTKSAAAGVSTRSTQWQLMLVPAQVAENYAPGGMGIALQFGQQTQSFEIGGMELINYGPSIALSDLPMSNQTYFGRSGSDYSWRDAAYARVEQLRKSDLTLSIRDTSGNLVTDATVRVRLDQHAFGFGTAVDSWALLEQPISNRTPYQNIVRDHFSSVVLENDLKWSGWQNTPWRAINALNWFDANGIDNVRGHNLIWPYWQYMEASTGNTYGGINYRSDPNKPDAQEEYEAHVAIDGQASARAWLRQRIVNHISSQASNINLQGRLRDWDVINEPWASGEVTTVVGQDQWKVWLDTARAADPSARLFVNDYPALDAGSHLDGFHDILASLKAQGAAIDGLGLQGHVGTATPDIDRVLATYDRFAQLELAMQITEFDITHPDEQLQADYLRDLMLATFSHEGFDSFLIWGFWAGRHWLPDAALWRQDWSIKPNGQMWVDLVGSEWTTDLTGPTNAAGQFLARGFDGRYTVEITHEGLTTVQTVTLDAADTAATVVIPDRRSPRVDAVVYEFDAPQPRVRIDFSEDIGATLTASDIVLTNTTTGQTLTGFSVSYDAIQKQARIGFASIPTDGRWTLTLPEAAVRDLSNNPNALASGSFEVLTGDADRDGTVGFSDLLIVAQNYGTTGRTFSQGNFDYDLAGRVDFDDLLIVAQRYGNSLIRPARSQSRRYRMTVIEL
jgi:GH35 family endo-1,4-beta-xylanase